jgi:hypothetical protein
MQCHDFLVWDVDEAERQQQKQAPVKVTRRFAIEHKQHPIMTLQVDAFRLVVGDQGGRIWVHSFEHADA